MSFLSNIFGGSKRTNPYKAGMPYLQQVPGVVGRYYNPYIQMGDTGRDLMGDLQGQFSGLLPGSQLGDIFRSMATDPASFQSQLGAGFQASPSYQFDRDQQLDAQSRALAAGGMLGSPEHTQMAQELANNLANREFGNYLGRQLGILGAGLSGLQRQQQLGLGGLQDLMTTGLNMGFGASDRAAQTLVDNLMQQANFAAGQAHDRRNREQGALGTALGVFSKPLSSVGHFLGL